MIKFPPLDSDIIAISLDELASPSIHINLLQPNDTLSGGWGFGWYPEDQSSSVLMKDPTARHTQIKIDTMTDWSNFRSTIFCCKVNGANKNYNYAETQPFSRSFAGRDWIFMHNGYIDKLALEKLHGETTPLLEPLGSTDSELAFCNLLTHLQESKAKRIAEVDPLMWLSWFQRFDALGSSDMTLTDGESLLCFHSTQSPKELYHARIQPPENQGVYECKAVELMLNDPRDNTRTALMISSSPFSRGNWTPMQAGQLMIIRQASIVWSNVTDNRFFVSRPEESLRKLSDQQANQQKDFLQKQIQVPIEQTQAHIISTRAITQTPEGFSMAFRFYEVKHTTQYTYTEPVKHSTHFFRLQPTDDAIQEVVQSRLYISSPTEEIQYEDVFGNQSICATIDIPYSQLLVEATSYVKVFSMPPDDHSLSRRKTSIPLIWMPWQRQMMLPYLLPPELPEDQLIELTDYAMSFVKRNDYQLLKTIEDMTLSIYRDYHYVAGSTSLATTPFEVYTSRQGVCQDFSNLFICLARLLSIPARYRMGYIYTGVNYANKIQSDASHAWAEVYLPYVGWRGFDPTNGCSISQDHIRVACGRHYSDATPTSGTIYKGGGVETLTVKVRMKEINNS